MRKSTTTPGFTLIELAIVIVIVGLLTTGILLGRDLVRAAEIKKIHTQATSYITAFATFKEKYNCLPGDCANAEEYFDPAPTCPAPDDSPVSEVTCNGNGNGKIVEVTEKYETWRHLALARLIEGIFSGAGSSENLTVYKTNYNCPMLLNERFCWTVEDPKIAIFGGASTLTLTPGNNGNIVLTMLAPNPDFIVPPSSWLWPISSAYALGAIITQGQFVLTPQEAYLYDMKYDDGGPASGWIQAENGFTIGMGCTTSQDASALYDLSKKERNCGLFYRTGF